MKISVTYISRYWVPTKDRLGGDVLEEKTKYPNFLDNLAYPDYYYYYLFTVQ